MLGIGLIVKLQKDRDISITGIREIYIYIEVSIQCFYYF